MFSNSINVTLIVNPFDPYKSAVSTAIEYKKNSSALDYIEKAVGPLDEEVVASVGGVIYSYDKIPQEGDDIVFCLVVAGGGSGGAKTIVRMVAIMVVAYYAPYAAAALMKTSVGMMGIGGYMLAAGITVAGSMLVNAVLPPPSLDMDKLEDSNFDRSTNYGWGAPSNQWSEGISLPSLIGRRRFAPPRIGALRYQSNDGSQQQYIRLLYALCDDMIKDLIETDIFANGTAITEYPQTTFDYTIGNFVEDEEINWFTDGTVTEISHSIALSEQTEVYSAGANYTSFTDEVWQPATPYLVNADVEVITFGAYFRRGLYHTISKYFESREREGYRNVRRRYLGFKFVVRHRLVGETVWTEREISVHPPSRKNWKFSRTLVLDGLTSGNQEIQFTVRDSENNSILINRITGLSSLTLIPTLQTNGVAVERLGVGLICPQGVYYINDAGNFSSHTVKVGIDAKPVGASNWFISHTETITDHTSATIRRFVEFDNLPPNQWEFRVYVSGLLPTDNRYKHDTLLDYHQEGIEDHVNYRGVACLAIQILATDALHGQYPTVEVLAETYDYADGRPSSNPAWAAYYRLLRHNIDESKIDLPQFQTWADFCTAEGLTINLYLDTQLTLQSVLNNIGTAGRGVVVNRHGFWGVIIDGVVDVAHTFNIDDIVEDSFEETFLPIDKLANTVIAWYFDENFDYRKTAVEVRDPAISSLADVKKIEITLYGVTNLTQAKKHCMMMLNHTRLTNRTVSWRADVDAIGCEPGDVVYLQHDLPEWGLAGGHVISSDAVGVSCDTQNDFSDIKYATKDFRLMLRHPSPRTGESFDFIETVEIDNPYDLGSPTNESVILYTLKVGQSWERVPENGSLVTIGWVVGAETGSGDEITSYKKFRVLNIERSEDQKFKLTGVEYYEGAYEDDYIVDLPTPESGLERVDLAKANSSWNVNGQLHTDFISLTWIGNASNYYVFYKVEIDSEYSEWVFHGSTGNTFLNIPDLPTDQNYIFSISTQNNPDNGAQVAIAHTTQDHQPIIEPIENIRNLQSGTTTWAGKDLEVTWDPFPMFSLDYYRVEVLDDLNNVLRTERVRVNYYKYPYEQNVIDNANTPSPTVRLRVVVIDQNGNEATSITQAFSNTLPSAPTNFWVLGSYPPTTDFYSINLELVWDPSPDEDFYAYEIWHKPGLAIAREEIVFNNYFHYTYSMMVSENGAPPHYTRSMQVRTIDAFGQVSAWNSKSFTNQPPSPPSNLNAEPWMNGVRFIWEQTGLKFDLDGFKYRLQIEAEPFSDWILTPEYVVIRFLTEAESIAYNGEASITIELVTLDTFRNESTMVTATHQTGSLNIGPTAIDDFSQISKAFPKIPVLIGDTWTDNSPSAGFVSWNEHSLWFNGVEYVIAAGNASNHYIWWLNGSNIYVCAPDIPSLDDDSFIIAVNLNGNHDLAWNAIANQVIGSAYIKAAAIQDLHVSDVSAEKLTANSVMTPGVYIGEAKYGSGGVQDTLDTLKPSEGGATDGATFGSNVKEGDHVLSYEEVINNSTNVFIDSDFSKTIDSNDQTYWTVDPVKCQLSINEGVDASKCIKLVSVTGEWSLLYVKQFLTWIPNKTLFVKFKVFISTDFDGAYGIGLNVLDKDKVNLITLGGSLDTSIKGAWVDVSYEFTPTNLETNYIRFYINRETGTLGHILIDNIYGVPYEDGATVGATWGGNLGSIPQRFGETPSSAGLYVTSTHLGYFDGVAWDVYIRENGLFYFGGDPNNFIEWDGANLNISGSLSITSPSTGYENLTDRPVNPSDPYLVAHYSFDEFSGTIAVDNSRHSHHLALTNTPPRGAGVSGRCLTFQVLNQMAEGSIYPQIDNISFTISLWVKFSNTNVNSIILQKGHSIGTGTYFSILRKNDNNISISFYADDLDFLYPHAADTTDFHLLSFTFDQPTREMKLYIDGVFAASRIQNGQLSSTNADNWKIANAFGADPDSFLGSIDELRIYHRVLTSNEISYLYNFPSSTPVLSNPDQIVEGENKFFAIDSHTTTTDSNIIVDPNFDRKVFEGLDYWFGNATFYPTHGEDSTPAVQITAVGGHHYAIIDHYIPAKPTDTFYAKVRCLVENPYDGTASLTVAAYDKNKTYIHANVKGTMPHTAGLWDDWDLELSGFPAGTCYIKPYFESIGSGTTGSFYVSFFYFSRVEPYANITENRVSRDTSNVSGYASPLIANSQGQIFRETFDDPGNDFGDRYTFFNGASNWTLYQSSEAISGGKFLRMGDGVGDDMTWFAFNESIPYDSSKLHRMKVRIRAHAGTTGMVQLGVVGRFFDDSMFINRFGAQGYGDFSTVSGESITLPANSAWQVYQGYFKGYLTTGGLWSADPANPTPLHQNIKYIRPIILVNQVSQPGIVDVDEITIEVLPETEDSPWRHPSDTTKIDGGDIYANSITLNTINGASGTLNIQAGGQISVSAGKISVSTVDGIEVTGTGGLTVLDGGDILMKSGPVDKSKIQFNDSQLGTYILDIYYSSGWLIFDPISSQTTSVRFGWTNRLDQFIVNSGYYNLSSRYSEIKSEALFPSGDKRTIIRTTQNDDGTGQVSEIAAGVDFSTGYKWVGPTNPYNNWVDLGRDISAWQDIYYYVAHDKCLHLDDLNDLEILNSVKPSKKYDEESGLSKLDISSLPRWATNYETLKEQIMCDCMCMMTEEDFDYFITDEDHLGYRLFRRPGHYLDLVAGAVKQLEKRLIKLEREENDD